MKDYHAEAMDALLEHGRFPRDDGKSLTSFIADAIKKAVDEEREACAVVAEKDEGDVNAALVASAIRERGKVTRPLLYVCAPYQTATEVEKSTRLDAVRAAVERGWCPIYAPFLLERAYPEESEAVRALALDCCVALLARCDALLVVGERRTPGMIVELEWWRRCREGFYVWPRLPDADARETT